MIAQRAGERPPALIAPRNGGVYCFWRYSFDDSIMRGRSISRPIFCGTCPIVSWSRGLLKIKETSAPRCRWLRVQVIGGNEVIAETMEWETLPVGDMGAPSGSGLAP